MSNSIIVSNPNHPLLRQLSDDESLRDQCIQTVNTYLNGTLKHYDSTKHVTLEWAPPASENPLPMSMNQLVKRSQDKRKWAGTEKEIAKAKREEFNAIRAVFIIEGLNDLMVAALYAMGYQPRFQGADKFGKCTVHFIPKHRQSDVVGKKAAELAGSLQGVRLRKALVAMRGEEAVSKFEATGELEVLGIEISEPAQQSE